MYYCISLVRSRNCIVALDYTSLHTTCLSCLKLVKHKKKLQLTTCSKIRRKKMNFIWDGSARTGTLGFLWMDYLQWKTQTRSEYFSQNILETTYVTLYIKIPGFPFLHFRLKWCSLTKTRSCLAILGEISWKRSTYRLKFEHGQLGKCLRNSLIRQCFLLPPFLYYPPFFQIFI
jgi:hypothetical protein